MSLEAMLASVDKYNTKTIHKATKPKHSLSHLASTVPRSPIYSVPDYMSTPYNYNGNTVYIVLVDGHGKFHCPLKPFHFYALKTTSGKRPWMISSFTEGKKVFFAVAMNSLGTILDGVRLDSS
ncbi:hypothetical protein EIN_058730 [Entamoeba invadens IP1]|uniref:hypothetical protein n=1 Tax=Entamoeba invadens IP1 TaxID=370355 RepID=UPI0002C3E236|nr:hypothetical protein EIN_058730 [Entamoeba invadens IP1]ELP93418.1 hypothetical protein EIN_058730 [Entamoeba invadens IP1]|eukprot:XP_004260189.1 hypothetical protein EIN_058730 [Entamoeba invadens IP1]